MKRAELLLLLFTLGANAAAQVAEGRPRLTTSEPITNCRGSRKPGRKHGMSHCRRVSRSKESLRSSSTSVPVATNQVFHRRQRRWRSGGDGVVRYVLVVKTSGGATNVSFEGIQLQGPKKPGSTTPPVVATKPWSKSQCSSPSIGGQIENKPLNRRTTRSLSRTLFCPLGTCRSPVPTKAATPCALASTRMRKLSIGMLTDRYALIPEFDKALRAVFASAPTRRTDAGRRPARSRTERPPKSAMSPR
jgi:hypothetical protein